jgi:hypothetical protein
MLVALSQGKGLRVEATTAVKTENYHCSGDRISGTKPKRVVVMLFLKAGSVSKQKKIFFTRCEQGV